MKRPLRWFVLGVGVMASLVVLLAGALYASGSRKLGRTYQVETAALRIPTDSASIQRGAHLARINGCTDCHGPDLSGGVMVDEPPFRVVASNLTSGRGGIGTSYSEIDLDRVIRHGVRPDGGPVLVMPSSGYNRLSDDDAARIIAYLRSLPPVDNELPRTQVRFLGRILAAVQIDPAQEVVLEPARSTAPSPSASAEYGEYLSTISCAHCHGADLRGAQPPVPGSPFAPDLIPASDWPFEDFEQTLRTGVRPGGTQMNPEFMPWTMTANMTEEELRAIQAHLAILAE